MGWIGCVRGENIQRDFVARTFALIAPVQPILHRVSCSNEMVPNAPKHYETHQNMSLGPDGVDRVDLLEKNSNATLWLELLHFTWVLGPMGWIGCIHCDKFGHDFVARTIASIAPFQLVLRRVSCSNEMVPNAPKHYETHQMMSLGSNGVDWLRLLWKHLTQLCGTNFCINCTSSAHFALSLLP